MSLCLSVSYEWYCRYLWCISSLFDQAWEIQPENRTVSMDKCHLTGKSIWPEFRGPRFKSWLAMDLNVFFFTISLISCVWCPVHTMGSKDQTSQLSRCHRETHGFSCDLTVSRWRPNLISHGLLSLSTTDLPINTTGDFNRFSER